MADYQIALIDESNPLEAARAVTALTLYLLEHEFDRGRFQMLLWALSNRCNETVQARAMVGLQLICALQNPTGGWILEQMADVLSYHDEMAYECWCALLESVNPDRFDPNFALMAPMYNIDVFQNNPYLYFELFDRGIVEEFDDFEWKLMEMFFSNWNLCDSDMFALLLMIKQYLPTIAHQLRENEVNIEDLEFMDIRFDQMVHITDGRHNLTQLDADLSIAENYVQQLYRYIKLSKQMTMKMWTEADLVQTMMQHMIIVGAERKNEAEEILRK